MLESKKKLLIVSIYILILVCLQSLSQSLLCSRIAQLAVYGNFSVPVESRWKFITKW